MHTAKLDSPVHPLAYPGVVTRGASVVSTNDGIFLVAADAAALAEAQAYLASFDPLVEVKKAKIEELKAACRNTIVAGFKSAALGSDHWYDGNIEDQINIMGAAAAGMDLPFRCTPLDASGNPTGPKQFFTHTAAQLQQVYQDGVNFKLAQLQKLDGLKTQVEQAATEAEVNAVSW